MLLAWLAAGSPTGFMLATDYTFKHQASFSHLGPSLVPHVASYSSHYPRQAATRKSRLQGLARLCISFVKR